MSASDQLPGAILFVCGQNSIRSPLAERLAKDLLGTRTFIQSAGVIMGERNPFVDVVLEEVGINPGVHRPRAIEDLEDAFFDVVITLSPEADTQAKKHWAANSVQIEYWPIEDPSEARGQREQVLEVYRSVRDDIKKRLAERF